MQNAFVPSNSKQLNTFTWWSIKKENINLIYPWGHGYRFGCKLFSLEPSRILATTSILAIGDIPEYCSKFCTNKHPLRFAYKQIVAIK